jgi:hypothetical protein
LQGNIGHGRNHAGDRDGKLKAARIVDAVDHVGGSDITIGMRRLPQHRHHCEDKRIHNDGVGQREEAVGADRIDKCRHRNHRVGGVKIAADQKPGDPSTELPAAQPPFVKMGVDRAGFPARGEESHHQKNRKIVRAIQSIRSAMTQLLRSFVGSAAAIDQPNQQRTDRHPSQLVPVEKRKAEQRRLQGIVERHPASRPAL